MQALETHIANLMQRRYARLVGRGTTALYLALHGLALLDGYGEVILPDVICSNVLDAVLLAGFTPVFADVTSDRFALDPLSVRQRITPVTRAVISAHVFGYVAASHDYGVPIIEDAVQGLGGTINGNLVGTQGIISFTSFNETKMVGGQGGAVATDDEEIWEAIRQMDLDLPHPQPLSPQWRGESAWTSSPSLLAERGAGGEVSHYAHYNAQLAAIRDTLIRPFDDRPDNVERIRAGWENLAANVSERNGKAQYLRDHLASLPLDLPEICPGDAVWRYSFAAPNHATAKWILRHLQMEGLSGSNLYPSLSGIFAPDGVLASQSFARNIVDLWVDAATDHSQLDRVIAVIRATPWERLGVLA